MRLRRNACCSVRRATRFRYVSVPSEKAPKLPVGEDVQAHFYDHNLTPQSPVPMSLGAGARLLLLRSQHKARSFSSESLVLRCKLDTVVAARRLLHFPCSKHHLRLQNSPATSFPPNPFILSYQSISISPNIPESIHKAGNGIGCLQEISERREKQMKKLLKQSPWSAPGNRC